MSDLTDFLLARIAEREADVRNRGTYAVGHSDRCIFEGGFEGTGDCDCGAPARVLAECEAKRRIVEEVYPLVEMEFGGAYRDDPASMLLRLLALPYADHPECREEWKP